MKLSALTFTQRQQPSQEGQNRVPFVSLQELLFTDLWQLWDKLQFRGSFRDSGERSQKINKKEIAKQRQKLEATPQAEQAFNRKITNLTEIYIGLNKRGYKEFVKQSYALIDKKYSQNSTVYLQATQLLAEFVVNKNKKTRLKNGYYPPPLTIKTGTKQNPYRIKPDWIRQGKKISQIITMILTHWQHTNFYQTVNDSEQNQKIAMGWLAISGIIFGGINDQNMLAGWLQVLLKKKLLPFIDYRVIANVRYLSEKYGNERQSDIHAKKSPIYNSQQICVDLVSQMWLLTARQIPNDVRERLVETDIEELVLQVLEPVLPEHLFAEIGLKFLLNNASYHWELLEKVSIDQTMVGIMQGTENTAGLLTSQFSDLFFDDFNCRKLKTSYDLTNLVSMTAKKPKVLNDNAIALSAEIRHSDLIAEIRHIFRKKYDKKRTGLKAGEKLTQSRKLSLHIEDLTSLLTIFNHISEHILIKWIISLLSGNRPILTESAEKYLSAIGYDWLYYTLGEDLLSWEEDDFEAIYEQILDFKRIELGNEAINYPAGRLQQLHDFAHKNFGIIKVEIEEAKSEKKVRAEWISFALYQAILRQIRLNVDSLEMDMLLSLFILLYRTGMRKLEILGIKYSDIENLDSGKPSIIVRPNQHRRLKTDVSNRRIPIYAFMMPEELQFVLDFLQSNRSNDKHQLVFTLSNSKERLPSTFVNKLLDNILDDIDLRKISHVVHGFRHTAISNISLILNNNIRLASTLTGLDAGQIANIKSELLGQDEYNQFGWYLVAGIAGHLSPERGLEYYNHFALLAATFEITKANPTLPRTLISNLTGLNIQNFKDNAINIEDNHIQLSNLRRVLYRQSLDLKHSQQLKNMKFDNTLAEILDSRANSSDDLFCRYSMNKLVTILEDFDNGLSNSEIGSKIKIPLEDIQLFRQRAEAIANIKTVKRKVNKDGKKVRQSKSRFVDANNRYQPIQNSFHIEQRMLHEIIKRATKFRLAQPQEWQWFITIISNRLTTSHATIAFKNRGQDLLNFQHFITIAEQIFTLEWCMYAHKNSLLLNIAEGLQEAELAHTKTFLESNKETFENRAKLIHHKLDDSQSTVIFGIKVKNPKAKPIDNNEDKKVQAPYKHMFSSLLRFFTHMMLLQDDTNFSLEDIAKVSKV